MSRSILIAKRLRLGASLGILCGLVALSLGCGGDDTVSPNDPADTGIPVVPVMTDPDQDPPMRSQTLSVVRKSADFAPRISAAHGSWTITGRATYESVDGFWVDCPGDQVNLYTGEAWSNALPQFTGCFPGCLMNQGPMYTPFCPPTYDLVLHVGLGRPDSTEWPNDCRFVFMKDFVEDPNPNPIEWDAPRDEHCRTELFGSCVHKAHIFKHYKVTGPSIDKTPYMRRDRFWVAVPWESGFLVERTTGNNTITLETSYTIGSSTTETESFAWSLGASTGLDLKGFQAKIEGSITKTFQTSFTMNEQATVSVSETLQGEANRRTCFMLWVLAEQYSFVDSEGKPYTDPGYQFYPGFHDPVGDNYYAFQVRGMAREIGKYVFDLTTNQLVSTEYVAVP